MRTTFDRTMRIAASAVLAASLGSGLAAADDAAPKHDPGARAAERVAPPADGGATRVTSSEHRTRVRSSTRIRTYPRSHGWYMGWGPYWGATWGGNWGGYWGGYWDPYWYGPRGGYTRVYPAAGERYGALDTDVSPERAELWIDGRKVGRADDFDGFPSYLWLDEGTYDVVFYLPGFKTLARQYSIYPGLVIDVEDRLESGEAVHPLDLAPTSHERRDERLRRDRERSEQIEGAEPAWEERDSARSGEWLDARAEPGRLRLQVEPADASVYLDGRFVGTGSDLARLRAGLLVDSGPHRLEIVRPGYRSAEHDVDVVQGEQTELRIDLEIDPERTPAEGS